MFRSWFLSFLLALCALPCAQASDELLVVRESYHSLVVVQCHNTQWVHFIRDGKVFARRYLTEDMVFHAEGPRWVLSWRDFWTANRVVYANSLWVVDQSEWTDDQDDGGPWWNAARPMVDLEAPPSQVVLWADRPRPTYAMQVPSEEFEPVHSVVRCRCSAMECTESLTLAKWKLLGPLDADKPAHWSCPACLRLKTPSKWEDT